MEDSGACIGGGAALKAEHDTWRVAVPLQSPQVLLGEFTGTAASVTGTVFQGVLD
jgi:hypothetical protein